MALRPKNTGCSCGGPGSVPSTQRVAQRSATPVPRVLMTSQGKSIHVVKAQGTTAQNQPTNEDPHNLVMRAAQVTQAAASQVLDTAPTSTIEPLASIFSKASLLDARHLPAPPYPSLSELPVSLSTSISEVYNQNTLPPTAQGTLALWSRQSLCFLHLLFLHSAPSCC